MKRILAFVLVLLCLLPTLCVTAFADQDVAVYLSEDLQQLQVGGTNYVRFNGRNYNTTDYASEYYSVFLSEKQKESILSAKIIVRGTKAINVELTVYYHDGSKLVAEYIHQDMAQAYEQLLQSKQRIIDFNYPQDNRVTIQKDALAGSVVVLSEDDYYDFNYFDICAEDQNGLRCFMGMLLVSDEQYYYVDAQENGIDRYVISIHDKEELKVHRVEDVQARREIAAALELYYGSDIGFLENEEITLNVTSAFLIALFVVIPLIVLVVFAIFTIRSKTPIYRKMCLSVCIWSTLVLIVSVTVMLVVRLGS